MSLSPARVEVLVWVLIYGGMLVASLGFAMRHGGHAFGWLFMIAGAIAVLAGMLLIWIRSRMNDPAEH